LEQLLTQKADTPSLKLLDTISRNVKRLLRLMNQLLDFRKMESGALALQVTHTDIIPCIQSIREYFSYQADEKQVALTFEPHVARQMMWVDTDKLEKILHNLLSNALKHTPQNGSIDVFTQELTSQQAKTNYPELKDTKCNNYMEITVSDTGTGIPNDKLDELFVQYRQIDSNPNLGGSGIGLYFSKRLIETHSGAITALNQPEGGMAFSLILPLEDVYAEDEKDTGKGVLAGRNDDTAMDASDESAEHPDTILIVEDNAELMDFIRTILEGRYRLLCASDGDEAWEIAQNEVPDLILSDVLMPGISGYQLCEQVKQQPALSHIPVILLTAKSSIDDQIEGLEHGADTYICKPFHVGYLLLTITNLLKNRETLRHYFTTPQHQGETAVPVKLNEIDQKFLNKLTQLLDLELDNTELNINSLSRNLGFSRTGFYRKMKGLTDMSPLDFLRNYRLKRAAEMIREDNFTLNEVAEKTGFGTYSYFSVMFKKHYGVSPKDYH
jgi:DNA-binding response OmpR family regulator